MIICVFILILIQIFIIQSHLIESEDISPNPTFAPTVYQLNPSYSCINDSEIVYNRFGEISFIGSFINCLTNTQDALLYPGYSSGQMLNVSVQVIVNNLIEVDEIQNSVSFDVFVLLRWFDSRFSMPNVWSRMDASVSSVDISQAMVHTNIQGKQPVIWLPDILFPEVDHMDITNTYINLYPEGELRWMRHLTLTLLESNFNYEAYPNDQQQIQLQFFSFALTNTQLQLIDFSQVPFQSYSGQPSLVFAVDDSGEEIFSRNPVWELLDSNIVFSDTRISKYNSYRSTCTVEITVQRRSAGLVFRLLLPIYILLFIGAIQFWVRLDSRIETTVTLLLAVSALYIVLFSNIPMVGYLTVLDEFGLGVYFVLFLCVVIHQIVAGFAQSDKVQKWPLKLLYAKSIESFARLLMIPIATTIFVVQFNTGLGERTTAFIIAAVTIGMTVVLFREIPSIYKIYKYSKTLLLNKIAQATLQDVEKSIQKWFILFDFTITTEDKIKIAEDISSASTNQDGIAISVVEVFAYNIWKHNNFSYSADLLLKEKGFPPQQSAIQMKTIDSVANPITTVANPTDT